MTKSWVLAKNGLMAKRKVAHKSFKLTPHSHPKEKVMIYVALAFTVGFVFGLMYADQAFAYIGLSVH